MWAIAHLSNPPIGSRARLMRRVAIRQGAVHVAVGLGLVGADVVELRHLQGAVSTNELR